MLACRSLPRLDQALRVATTRAALNRLGGNSQGHCSYHVFSYARRKSCKSYTESVMNKKRQSANLVWRAVSTQPVSSGESEFVDHVVEVENVLEQTAVLDNLTTLVEAVAHLCPTATAHGDRIEVLEDIGTGMNHATSSSAAFQDNNELMDAEEVLADGITTSLLLNSTGNVGTGDAVGASISPGSHSASLTVGASVMRFIREKREFIEEETGVYLIFPSSKKEHAIVIQGNSADCITKASEKIQSVINEVNNSESNLLLRFEDKQFCWEPQESLLQTCESRGIVKQAFPLHDEKRRKQLIRSWALNWWDCTTQPIDDVQLYFGTKIALYFAFLAMYTRWLFFPAALGIILQLVNFGSLQFLVLPVFFTSVISWAVFFFQFWKRKNFALLTRWRIPYTIGTGPGFKILGMEWNPLHYPAETGKKSQADHVKEKQIYQRHEWFTRIKRFRNDAIIILSIICLQLPFELAYAHLYEIIESSTIKFILTAVYLLLIQYFTRIGGKISVNLIKDEKVENSENRADSLVYKVFGLYFMQTYIGIFYHALLHRNILTLRQVLKQRLIVSEVFDNLLENSLPFLKYSFKKYGAVRNRRKGQKASSRDKVQFTSRVEKEYLKPDYAASTGAELEDGLFDDFLELTLQFGMIMMFACAFPLAFVFAAVNNIMEIRTDALKLLTIFKRPVPRSTATIGAWLSIFQFLIVLSICTNCALLVCLYDAEGNWKLEPGLAAILIIEHVLLLIKFGFSRLVPEEPAWVRANRMKNVTNAQDVCSKQLLRNISNKEMSRQEKVE